MMCWAMRRQRPYCDFMHSLGDTTRMFAGKGKCTWWKAFIRSSPQVIQALCELETVTMPSAETGKSLEKYACHMYSSQAEFDETGKLHWQLFKHAHAEAEKMPLTKDVLKYHILRAHYQAVVWSLAAILQPTLPQPTMFGWNAEGGLIVCSHHNSTDSSTRYCIRTCELWEWDWQMQNKHMLVLSAGSSLH